MGFYRGPKIVTDGLVLSLDAGNEKSYSGSGTTWFDKSGNGNNGTLVNGPTFNSDNGGSIVFDGVNDYVICGNTVGNFGTSNFTINFYFKTTDSGFPATFIAKSAGSNPRLDYGWLINNGSSANNLGFATATTTGSWGSIGSYSVQTSGTSIRDGLWKMATIVGDRTQSDITIYINGIQRTLQNYVGKSAFSTLGNIANNLNYTVGAESDTGISPVPIEASISNVQTYNRALTAEEILQNYNATKSRFNL